VVPTVGDLDLHFQEVVQVGASLLMASRSCKSASLRWLHVWFEVQYTVPAVGDTELHL
jgi:hypothetical protein